MNSPKRNAGVAAGVFVDSGNDIGPHENRTRSPAPKCRVIGIKAGGRPTTVCTRLSRGDADRWVAQHRRFDLSAAGDVVVEVDSSSLRESAS